MSDGALLLQVFMHKKLNAEYSPQKANRPV
jgi:hypothetical protein